MAFSSHSEGFEIANDFRTSAQTDLKVPPLGFGHETGMEHLLDGKTSVFRFKTRRKAEQEATNRGILVDVQDKTPHIQARILLHDMGVHDDKQLYDMVVTMCAINFRKVNAEMGMKKGREYELFIRVRSPRLLGCGVYPFMSRGADRLQTVVADTIEQKHQKHGEAAQNRVPAGKLAQSGRKRKREDDQAEIDQHDNLHGHSSKQTRNETTEDLEEDMYKGIAELFLEDLEENPLPSTSFLRGGLRTDEE